MKNFDFEILESEFEAFARQEECLVSAELSQKIKSSVRQKVVHSKINAIATALMVHLVSGLLILTICPQFNIQIIKNFAGLQHVFMKFGSHVCLFLCGALFLSTSVAMSGFILSPVSKRYLYSIRYFHIGSLTALSLVAFALASTVPFNTLTLMWVLGALLCGNMSSKILLLEPSF